MITHIQLPFVIGLLYPGLRYHYAGGASGPFGDTMDAIRLDTSAPEGEALLTERPTEEDLIDAAILNCVDYPSVIQWDALPVLLSVTPAQSSVAVGAIVDLTLGSSSVFVVLQDGDTIDSVSAHNSALLQFQASQSGTYTIHVFDRTTYAYGRAEVVVA